MGKVYFQDGDNYHIGRNKIVSVTQYEATGEIGIVDTSNAINGLGSIAKISKSRYYDLKSNTTKLYNLNSRKSIESLNKSMKYLEKKLRNNFSGGKNELFVTLTTREVTDSVDEIKLYFREFWYQLKILYTSVEYAYVIERQPERHSWHFHLLLKDTKNKILYIPNETIEKLWNKGYTKTSRVETGSKYVNIDEAEYIENIDNIWTDNEEVLGIDRVIKYMTKTRTKRAIPIGARCFETSRGLKSPNTRKIKYSDIYSEMREDYQLKSENTLLVKDKATDVILNKIKKENWEKLR